MTYNLFDNAKFGDMFLTTENKQAVFLRFTENAEYEFAILYVEGWGNVQVFRNNGKAIYNDVAHSIVSKKEEPVSEELEEEIKKTIHNHFFDLNGIAVAGTSVYATVDDMVYIAKHFAKKFYDKGYFDGHIHDGDRIEHVDGRKVNVSRFRRVAKPIEAPVSEDLEEAAEQDVCEVVNTCSATGIPNDHIPSWVQDAMINEFIHGAKWQKEQMIEKAIDGEVGYWNLRGLSVNVKLPRSVKEGDKVKVLVVKDE